MNTSNNKKFPWYRQKKRQENAIALAVNLTRMLKAPVTVSTIRKTLKEHPQYPDLISLVDSLTDWGIKAEVFEAELKHVKEARFPCVTSLQDKDRPPYFVILTAYEKNSVTYLHPRRGWITESPADLKKKWAGIIVQVTKTAQSGEKNYRLSRRREILNSLRSPFLMLAIASMLAFPWIFRPSLDTSVWFPLVVIKCMGVVLSLFLVRMEIATTHQGGFLDRVCRMGKNFNCSNVLHSSAARIFGLISMAEIGLVYFSGGLTAIALSFTGFREEPVFQILSLLTILALPYTLFSLYTQARIIKSWCVFCLSVLSLLWIEFFILRGYIFSFSIAEMDFNAVGLASVSFLLPAAGWIIIKPLWTGSSMLPFYRREFTQMQRDINVFLALLQEMPKIENAALPGDLVIGNKDAPITLTIASAPICRPCIEASSEIKALLGQYPDEIKAVYRSISLDEVPISQHILHFALSQGTGSALKALEGWYDILAKSRASAKDTKRLERLYRQWLVRFPLEHDDKAKHEVKKIYQKHAEWFKAHKIQKFPSLFINGFELPPVYPLLTLRYFIEDLPEHLS